jgi:hypothetical protein
MAAVQVEYDNGVPRCLADDPPCVTVWDNDGTSEWAQCLTDVCGAVVQSCARKAYCPGQGVFCFDSCTVDSLNWAGGAPHCDDGTR